MARVAEQTSLFDLLCIGSGPAGTRAAIQAAKAGFRVAVVEKMRVVGGYCLDSGTIPSKTLREAVMSVTGPRIRFRGEGKRHRPTMRELLSRVSHVIEMESGGLEHRLERNDVELIRGAARFRDPHTVVVDGPQGSHVVRAEKILIACGTRPAPPPDDVAGHDMVITSDGVLEMERLPRSMAVIGGGVIGIEYASIFAALGVEVTVVDRRERPLEFMDREIVDELIHQMRNHRVSFRLGEAVGRLYVHDGPPKRAVIELESGKRIVSDLVLFSVGRRGATDRLDVAKAGLTADRRGRLTVDERFCTEVPHIFAAGDVIGYPSLAATSMEQGRLAACHAFDLPAGPMADHFPIGIYSIPELSMAGETEQQLTLDRIPYEVGIARYRDIARGQILGDETGFLKLLFHRETRRLLGVHVVGTGATELVHIGQAVLALESGLDYFLNTVFNYPTLAECYKVAGLDAANKLSRYVLEGVSSTATAEVPDEPAGGEPRGAARNEPSTRRKPVAP